MDALKRLSKVFKTAKEIPFDDSSKFILISDCHRGDGSWADDFSKNKNIYFAALNHYYNEKYTYIELGDGDELWENNNLYDIMHIHSDIFWVLSKFFNDGRLYLIFGNHDIVKKDEKFIKRNQYYFDERKNKQIPIFENIYEGLILRHSITGGKVFLVHGHQVEWLNGKMWWLGRFLCRYFWKPLELFGVNDPTSTAKNYKRKDSMGKKLIEWVTTENQMLIAGHTHRPMFSEVGEPPYFNVGSCVHPHVITGIEIANGEIILVKWDIKTKSDGTLFVDRDVIAGPRKLIDYLKV